jgi:hypothetical protein
MSIQDSVPAQPDRAVAQASPHDVIGVGLAFSAAGLYFMLGAAGYAPLPESNSPAFIAFCAGAAFLFAIIGTYVAIGSGPHAFSLSTPLAEMQTTGEAVGRTVFGLGAVIVWIYVIALTVGTVRKLFDRRGG